QSPSTFEVTASVSDAQIAAVHVGQAAAFTPAGQPTPLPGTVSQITPLATIVQGVAAFPVIVTLNGDPAALFAGASAQLAIVVRRASHVLTVPASSVHGGGSRGTYVFVLSSGKEVRRKVTVGASDATLAQISSGLTSGEKVVLAQVNKPLPSGSAGLFGRKAGGGGGGSGRGKGGKGGASIP
ncbi:MAG: efflux RND transporter periplasmic adaptor subunit, partial [Candidatus Dormibacteria bacterium]